MLRVDASGFYSQAILEHRCHDRAACKKLQKETSEKWSKIVE